jgi:hypothetical protein
MFRLCILCIVCKCVLFHCHRVSTQLQLNISYHNVEKCTAELATYDNMAHVHCMLDT